MQLYSVAGNHLVGPEREVNADVLEVVVSAVERSRQVCSDPDIVVSDMRVVEGICATGAEEHPDSIVEINEPDVGNCPVLIVAAVEEKYSFKVDRRHISRPLDCRVTQVVGGEGHPVETRRWIDTVIVDVARNAVAAFGPAGGRIRFDPIERSE